MFAPNCVFAHDGSLLVFFIFFDKALILPHASLALLVGAANDEATEEEEAEVEDEDDTDVESESTLDSDVSERVGLGGPCATRGSALSPLHGRADWYPAWSIVLSKRLVACSVL